MALFQRNEVLRAFRVAHFATQEETSEFLRQHAASPATELSKLPGLITELAPRSDPRLHSARCSVLEELVKGTPSTELFVPFLRALRQADETLAASLARVLPTINEVSRHDDLCECLGAPAAHVRSAAAEVLRQVGGRTALEILTRRCSEPGFPGRIEAINALAARAGQHALPLLAATLQHGRPLERTHALRQLGVRARFRDIGPVSEVIAKALSDREELVVAQAVTALGTLDEDLLWLHAEPLLERASLEVLRAFLIQAVKHPNETVASMLRDRFREGPKTVRFAVLEAIERSPSELFLPTLVEALSFRDLSVRTRAAHILSELSRDGRVDTARAIVWLLRSKDVNVRRLAAEITTQLGNADGELAQRLLAALRDDDWWVRERVLDALVEMKMPSITKHLVKDYLADRSAIVRRFAIAALARLGDARALGALVRVAQADEDWLVGEAAVDAIGRLGDQRAVAYLVDLLRSRPELRIAAVGALRRLSAADAVPDVAELVHDDDPDVRSAAITFLEALDDGSHALWVKGCEDDPDPVVREAAVRLLKRFALAQARGEGAISELRSLDAVLESAVDLGADDLFLAAGRPPYVKKAGALGKIGETVLTAAQIEALLEPHLSAKQREDVAAKREIDFSYQLASRGVRFRVNVFVQRTGLSAVMRVVRSDLVSLDSLGLPQIVKGFAELSHGLVLVGGPTGAGKSTTLAALIQHMSTMSARHIVTIEDPIEVMHERNKCLINQREIGQHTRSFSGALRAALRQDPDVILVGELRDLETISFAVTAAETGHLVLGTVHTTAAEATVDRMINAFPPRQHSQVRAMLADSLRAVTCQYLLTSTSGGRRPAVEVMVANEGIRSLIRKGKTFQIPTMIATSREAGMQLMDSELIRLAKEGLVEIEEAYAKALDKRTFEAALGLPPSDPERAAEAPTSGRVSVAAVRAARST